jgi:meromycolic acid enoyl-[acyl-carrier-protein] reductase
MGMAIHHTDPLTGLLAGKRLLVTGVARPDSIAFAVARRAQLAGAEVALAVFPRDLEAVEGITSELPRPPAVTAAVDATDPEQLAGLEDRLRDLWGHVDGALHAIAFAPSVALQGILDVPSSAVEVALRTSTHSYAALGKLVADLAPESGASLVGLDFDSSRAWTVYNWMGPCKAALRSLNQYLARDLGPRGVRTNLVAAGPLRTRAAGGIPDFDVLLEAWERRAALPWDPTDAQPVADAVCFLFSDLARAITGEILHVDGGAHAIQ